MTRFACLALLLFAASPASAQTTIMGGNVINQRWTPLGRPYTVRGDITVPMGAYLEIEAGTIVRFETGDLTRSGEDATEIELRVAGRLTVLGTMEDPAIFESVGTTGQWDGIRLVAGSDATSIVGALSRVTSGTGVLYANPLYVAPPANLRLTSRSPSRNSAADGTDQGALPYVSDATPGLYGTVWSDATIDTTLLGPLSCGEQDGGPTRWGEVVVANGEK